MPTASQSQISSVIPGRLNLRDMLILGGAGQFMADNSIPFMFMLPGTCEPYAQGVIQIVECLQRLLNMRGSDLEVDGGLGAATQDAVRKWSGPRWYEKSWAQIYQDVIKGKPWTGFRRQSRDPITAQGANLAEETAENPFMRGMGDDTVASQFAIRNNVAIPLTVPMLAYFQSLQRIVNAINAVQKRPLVAVDGRIGEQTADAVGVIANKNGSDPWANVNITPTFVANNIVTAVSELLSLMGRIGATYVADPVTLSKPSVAKADGTVVNPPDGPSTTTLVVGAIAAGALLAYMGKKKKRRK